VTGERAQAYGRVVRTLEDLGPVKLLPAEQATIRAAADALLFGEDAEAPLETVHALAAALVAADRWTPERAAELVADVAGCGREAYARTA
jgi:hypothetical protein